MDTLLNPYIARNGDARAMLEHYRDVLGGDLEINTYEAFGQDGPNKDKVMHGMLAVSPRITIMAADSSEEVPAAPCGMSISLSGADEKELRRFWDGLIVGGTATMPLEPAPWGDTFGMCVDRFGVSWMVNIVGPTRAAE